MPAPAVPARQRRPLAVCGEEARGALERRLAASDAVVDASGFFLPSLRASCRPRLLRTGPRCSAPSRRVPLPPPPRALRPSAPLFFFFTCSFLLKRPPRSVACAPRFSPPRTLPGVLHRRPALLPRRRAPCRLLGLRPVILSFAPHCHLSLGWLFFPPPLFSIRLSFPATRGASDALEEPPEPARALPPGWAAPIDATTAQGSESRSLRPRDRVAGDGSRNLARAMRSRVSSNGAKTGRAGPFFFLFFSLARRRAVAGDAGLPDRSSGAPRGAALARARARASRRPFGDPGQGVSRGSGFAHPALSPRFPLRRAPRPQLGGSAVRSASPGRHAGRRRIFPRQRRGASRRRGRPGRPPPRALPGGFSGAGARAAGVGPLPRSAERRPDAGRGAIVVCPAAGVALVRTRGTLCVDASPPRLVGLCLVDAGPSRAPGPSGSSARCSLADAAHLLGRLRRAGFVSGRPAVGRFSRAASSCVGRCCLRGACRPATAAAPRALERGRARELRGFQV